jgi:hypothetical protein
MSTPPGQGAAQLKITPLTKRIEFRDFIVEVIDGKPYLLRDNNDDEDQLRYSVNNIILADLADLMRSGEEEGVSLSCYKFDDQKLLKFLDVFSRSTLPIKSLSFFGAEEISALGFEDLAKALHEEGMRPAVLNLEKCTIPDEVAEKLAEGMADNKDLIDVAMADVVISLQAVFTLREILLDVVGFVFEIKRGDLGIEDDPDDMIDILSDEILEYFPEFDADLFPLDPETDCRDFIVEAIGDSLCLRMNVEGLEGENRYSAEPEDLYDFAAALEEKEEYNVSLHCPDFDDQKLREFIRIFSEVSLSIGSLVINGAQAISREGWKGLFDALKARYILPLSIHLGDCEIPDDMVEALGRGLVANEDLQSVTFSNVKISQAAVFRLGGILQKCEEIDCFIVDKADVGIAVAPDSAPTIDVFSDEFLTHFPVAAPTPSEVVLVVSTSKGSEQSAAM